MSQEYAFLEEAILRSIGQIKYAPNFLHYFQISPPEKWKAFPNQNKYLVEAYPLLDHMVMCCFIYMVSVTSYSKLLRQLSKADIDSEMQNIIAKVAVLVNVKYSIWVQVGITQNCTLFNVMQRQGQEKDEQAVRREQRRGGGSSS